jgi:alpha-glucosidase (family GH31 glycosyl hydrolase)
VGSDIGGYLNTNAGTDVPFDLEVFQRWTAMSGLMPFFQLHGRANLAPWTVDGTPAQIDETVDAYRYWAQLHHALVPFFYSLAREGRMMATVPDVDWTFLVGDAFLVAPLYEPGGTRSVNARGIDWWDLAADSIDETITFTAPSAREIPVFVQEGAIIPLQLDHANLIDDAPALGRTILIFPGAAATSFTLHSDSGTTSSIRVDGDTIELDTFSGAVTLRVRTDATAVAGMSPLGSLSDAGPGYFTATRALWIKLDAAGDAEIVLQ